MSVVAQSGGITVTVPPIGKVAVPRGADVSGRTIHVANAAIGADVGLRGAPTFAPCGTAPTAIDCTTVSLPNDNRTIFVATTNTSNANELPAFHIAVF
jgi:hypothetical protein